MQNVIVETVLLVPERDSFAAKIAHGVRYIDKMFKKLAGNSFVRLIFAREFQRNGQHIKAVHPHPARAVGLLDVAARGKRRGAVKNADIVEAKESALENVHPFDVLAVNPPLKIK